MTSFAPPPCRMLIGPLIRPFFIGSWSEHPDILPFTYHEGVQRYYAQVLDPEYSRFSPRCLRLDFEVGPRHSLADLWRQLPPGWQPDLLIWWGFFFPLPHDIADCPVPSVLVVSDWHTCLSAVLEYVPQFDHVCADKGLLRILAQRGHRQISHWPGYSWDPATLGPQPERDIDVCFIGNLNPAVYRDRNRALQRLLSLAPKYRFFCGARMYHHEYARLLQRSKIVFNQGLRGEMNMRAYEAAAAGALVLMETGNLEVRDYLRPDSECVLYAEDDLVEKVEFYLHHAEQLERIANAGRQRIQAYDFDHQLAGLFARIAKLLPELNPALRQRPAATEVTWLQARHVSRIQLTEPLQQANELLAGLPADNPVRINARAVVLAHQATQSEDPRGLGQAAQLLRQLIVAQGSARVHPILLLNLAWICFWRQDSAPLSALLGQAMTSLCADDFDAQSLSPFADFVLPMGFCTFAQEWERLPERVPPEALNLSRRQLLIWNGLLLQGQISGAEQALPFLRAAAGLLPELPDAWLAIGQVEAGLGHRREALIALEAGLKLGGTFPWVYLALIGLRLQKGDLEPARVLLAAAEALFHGPGLDAVRTQLAGLRRQADLNEGRQGFG